MILSKQRRNIPKNLREREVIRNQLKHTHARLPSRIPKGGQAKARSRKVSKEITVVSGFATSREAPSDPAGIFEIRSNRRLLFRSFLLMLPALWMLGCSASSRVSSSSGNKYRYFVSLSAPEKSAAMLFRDDRFIIQFRFDDPAIRFQLQNISQAVMQLDWANASLRLGGPLLAVRSISSFYDTSFVPAMSSPIPPLGVVRDVVAPRPNITVRGRTWHVADLLPTTDANSFDLESAIRGAVGRTVELTLPVRFGAAAATYRFVFSIDSVKQISWSEYRPPAWLPPAPPMQSVGPSSEDRITTAIIVGGFVGFVRYVMTMKKTPVVE